MTGVGVEVDGWMEMVYCSLAVDLMVPFRTMTNIVYSDPWDPPNNLDYVGCLQSSISTQLDLMD